MTTKPVKENPTVLQASPRQEKSFALQVVGEIKNDLVMKNMFFFLEKNPTRR